MNEKKCRWAILGAAGIARKNWQAISQAGNAALVAVAARDAALLPGLLRLVAGGRLVPVPERTRLRNIEQ